MTRCRTLLLVLTLGLCVTMQATAEPPRSLPPEPSQDFILDEIYDNEAALVIFTYSLKHDGVVDYVTGRKVVSWRVNDYGNGVYDIERFPVFYWYDRTLWRDMEADGVNGNEIVYVENVGFDLLRYK